jgi:hypothetical protein
VDKNTSPDITKEGKRLIPFIQQAFSQMNKKSSNLLGFSSLASGRFLTLDR